MSCRRSLGTTGRRSECLTKGPRSAYRSTGVLWSRAEERRRLNTCKGEQECRAER